MSDVRFAQASAAYRDALGAAERILARVEATQGAVQTQQAQGTGFLDLVADSFKSATNKSYESEALAMRAIAGKADLADVVTAVTNAETALSTVVSVRDKVITAYQDIIKMPI